MTALSAFCGGRNDAWHANDYMGNGGFSCLLSACMTSPTALDALLTRVAREWKGLIVAYFFDTFLWALLVSHHELSEGCYPHRSHLL